MPAWEFMFFELYLGERQDHPAVIEAQEQIKALGADGWEPVAPVDFKYHQWSSNQAFTMHRTLMLKRPLAEPAS